MKNLHPGQRVYIGYTPKRHPDARGMCQKGTLVSGPHPQGAMLIPPEGIFWPPFNGANQPVWILESDALPKGEYACAVESIIYPLDDDEDGQTTEEKKGKSDERSRSRSIGS